MLFIKKANNTWERLQEMPPAVAAATAVCKGVKVYVIGGAGSHRRKMDCLDITAMTWSTCPDLLQGLMYPIAGCVRDCICVIFTTHSDNEITAQGITLQCFD